MSHTIRQVSSPAPCTINSEHIAYIYVSQARPRVQDPIEFETTSSS
jgi:hypothetical protein